MCNGELVAVPLASLSRSKINKSGKRVAKVWPGLIDGSSTLRDLSSAETARLGEAIAVIDAFRHEHAYPLTLARANLVHYVRDIRGAGVTQRLKKLPTILDKLGRYSAMSLSTMEDIGGVRVVVPKQADADELSRRLRKNWTVDRYRDYVRSPKESGYRALHLIALKKGHHVEVQIRTKLQDAWANQVEQDSRRQRTDFKSGLGRAEVHAYYVLVGGLLALQDRSEAPDDLFMQELVDAYRLAKPFLSTETTP